MQPAVPEHTHIDIAYGAGNQAVNDDETLESDNDYYSTNENRMEVDDSRKETSRATFSFTIPREPLETETAASETAASTVGRSSNFLLLVPLKLRHT